MTRRRELPASKSAGSHNIAATSAGPASWRSMLRPLGLALCVGLATTLSGVLIVQAQPTSERMAPPAGHLAAAPAPIPVNVSAEADMLRSLSTAAGRDAFLKQYCVVCHSARMKTGGLVLEGESTTDSDMNAELWEKVIRRVAAGEMPPPNARRPDAQAAHTFVASLVEDLDAAALKAPYAGPSVIRRLNRTEYGNAVRDLLAVDFPFATELPADSLAGGFDNIGDALSMSPVLLESYLKVGRKVSELAVGVADRVADAHP